MIAKIISIGDELLLGQTINSNAAFISNSLYDIGIPTHKIVTIGDNENDLIEELNDSTKNYDVTIITGGLGPTHDDITKDIMVKYFNDKLVQNVFVLDNIKKLFFLRGLKMPEINIEQALFPAKAKPIYNINGTAPGILYEKFGKVIIALPGVPMEMKSMITKQVIPYLSKKFKDKLDVYIKSKTILTTGITESKLFEELGDIKKLTGENKLAFLPSPSGVRLRIDVKGISNEDVISKIQEIEKSIHRKVGKYIYGVNEETLEEKVGIILRKKGLTLSIAESCTGGLLSSMITDVSGSSDYYMGGICSYSNNSKIKILGVNHTTIEEHGAVSKHTAEEMSLNVRKIFKSDIGISITGIAGPTGGTKDKPVGLIWIGYSDKNTNIAKKFLFGQNREKNKQRAVMASLSVLYSNLNNYI